MENPLMTSECQHGSIWAHEAPCYSSPDYRDPLMCQYDEQAPYESRRTKNANG